MNTLALIAALALTDGLYNPPSVQCINGNASFSNPYQGTLAADSGVFSALVADGGALGGPWNVGRVGQIAGSPGPTCGTYITGANTFDGGASCATGSTDMYGTIVATSRGFTCSTAMLYVQPGTPFASGTQCVVRFGGSDAGNPGIPITPMYQGLAVQYDAGANAIQIGINGFTCSTIHPPPTVAFSFDWLCIGP